LWLRTRETDLFQEYKVCNLEISTHRAAKPTNKGNTIMKSLYYFEKLFDAGVTYEEAPDVLYDYMERGAKVAIDWKQEGNDYLARLMVSTLED